ncbi:MAG TPA: hypothetical protein VHM65_02630, partial [Candidatus Lustribacter sp.]|nr:hypothetical protein [Candidatus Lustribacter sp.]
AVARVNARTAAAETPRTAEPRSLTEHPRTHLALAMLNAMHGDLLDDLDSPLTLTMALRHTRRDVSLNREALAATYPHAAGTLVVFLHGLAENDDSWAYRAQERFGDAGTTYGTLLEHDLGVTALYVRYNTGLRISANGALLAELLGRLRDAWPAPVEQIVLVGHSMGGLVIHSALFVDDPWAELVSHTITLGAPHLGAPLEQAVTRLAHGVPRSATLRVMRQILRGRSAGIKDLRHGNLVHADWHGHDPDDPSNRRVAVRPHPAPRHHAIVSTVTKDPGHAVGAVLGDLMVLPHSAGGLETPDDQICRIGGLHHLDLLNHPSVYAQILTWLR